MKIKRTLQPYVDNGKIVFGFGNDVLTRKFDYSEENKDLVKKLDIYDTSNVGKYTVAELKKIESWRKKGLLTNNSYDDSKYSRNVNFFEWIDLSGNIDPTKYQKELSQKVLLIVGLGGIGGNISEILCRLGVKNLIILDYDIVDESNLTRQSVFQEKDLGELKVDMVEKYLTRIDSSIKITKIKQKILSKKDLENVYQNYDFDVALCCADTPVIKIDYWFDELSQKYNIPFITGSYASTVINYACIDPKKTITLHEFYGENMITDENMLENKAPTSIIAPISYMAAGLVAYRTVFELIDLYDGMPNALQLDLLSWEVFSYDLSK